VRGNAKLGAAWKMNVSPYKKKKIDGKNLITLTIMKTGSPVSTLDSALIPEMFISSRLSGNSLLASTKKQKLASAANRKNLRFRRMYLGHRSTMMILSAMTASLLLSKLIS